MLSPEEIRGVCERKYAAYLRSLVTGEAFFPLPIPFGRPKPSHPWSVLDSQITALAESTLGYRIEWEETNSRRWGRQRFPHRVWFDDESSFLKALRKQTEVDTFRRLLAHTREACPELDPWLPAHVMLLIDHTDEWPRLLLVCRYFMTHPRPGRYARELPIAVDTKFIERHPRILRSLLDFLLPPEARLDTAHFESRFGLRFEEPRVHLRVLDPELQQRIGLPVDDLAIPVSQLARLAQPLIAVVIVENKKTFLTLPALHNSLAILGGGGAAELLTANTWLAQCRLIYWGDIDVHGFHILARLRRAFPELKSAMMALSTLEQFRVECGDANPCPYEDTASLTEAEHAAYERVRTENLLLEQEKIPYEHSVAQLASLLAEPSNVLRSDPPFGSRN
jgi:hypothetical protein